MQKVKSSVTSRTKNTITLKDFMERPSTKKWLIQVNSAEGKTEAAYIQTASRLQMLRDNVERHQEYWGITWLQFARLYVGIEKNRRGIVMRLMDAKDRNTQEAIVRVFLNKQNARAEKSRDNKRKNVERDERAKEREQRLSEKRIRLRAWAVTAKPSDIDKVWSYIGRV